LDDQFDKRKTWKARERNVNIKLDNLFKFLTHLSKQVDQFTEDIQQVKPRMAGHQEMDAYEEKERMLARKNVVMETGRKVPSRLMSSSLTAKVSVLL